MQSQISREQFAQFMAQAAREFWDIEQDYIGDMECDDPIEAKLHCEMTSDEMAGAFADYMQATIGDEARASFKARSDAAKRLANPAR